MGLIRKAGRHSALDTHTPIRSIRAGTDPRPQPPHTQNTRQFSTNQPNQHIRYTHTHRNTKHFIAELTTKSLRFSIDYRQIDGSYFDDCVTRSNEEVRTLLLYIFEYCGTSARAPFARPPHGIRCNGCLYSPRRHIAHNWLPTFGRNLNQSAKIE